MVSLFDSSFHPDTHSIVRRSVEAYLAGNTLNELVLDEPLPLLLTQGEYVVEAIVAVATNRQSEAMIHEVDVVRLTVVLKQLLALGKIPRGNRHSKLLAGVSISAMHPAGIRALDTVDEVQHGN